MVDNNKIILTMEDGSILEYEVVATFYLKETNKKYIVCTDEEYTDNMLNIFIISDNDDKYEYVSSKDEINSVINKLNDLGFDGVNYEK